MGFMFFCKVTIQIIYLRVQRTRYPEQVIHMLYHVCLYASFLTCWDACISPCQNDAHIKEFEGPAWPMPPPLRDRWQWVLWLNAISFLFLSLLDNLEGGIVLAGDPLLCSPQSANFTWLWLVHTSELCDSFLISQFPLWVTTWAGDPIYRVYGHVPNIK